MGTIVLLAFVALLALFAAFNWRKFQSWGVALQVFYREVRVEMQKVAWPSRNDVIGSTIVVLVAIVAVTVVITGADEILSLAMRVLLHVTDVGRGA